MCAGKWSIRSIHTCLVIPVLFITDATYHSSAFRTIIQVLRWSLMYYRVSMELQRYCRAILDQKRSFALARLIAMHIPSAPTVLCYLLLQVDLCSIAGHLCPKEHIWLHPSVCAGILCWRSPQLIEGEIDVTIWRNGKRVNPTKSRVTRENRHSPVRWFKDDN